MNAKFTDALAAVKWIKAHEARGLTVDTEIRGKTIFVTAYRGQPARRTA